MGDTNIVNCCVPLCNSRKNSRTLSFYKFPKDDNLKSEWVQVLMDMKMFGTIVTEKGSNSVSEWHICSRHFTADDFEKPPDNMAQLRKAPTSSQEPLVKRSLCKDAVPSVFPVSYMKQKKKEVVSNKKVIIVKRKARSQGRATTAGAAKKMKDQDGDEKAVSRTIINAKNVKIVVTSASPIVVPRRPNAIPRSNAQVIVTKKQPQNTSAKMENIVHKMELTLKPKPKPSPTGRKPIPGVPDNSTSNDSVMSWLCLPQNIHAPYKPEPVTMPRATSSNKVFNKQPERRSPRAVVIQPTPPKVNSASVDKKLVVSKPATVVVVPVPKRIMSKPQKNTSACVIRVTPPPPPPGKHRPPRISLANAIRKPSKQNIQNAEPERKQPGTVQSMLSDAITKVFANPTTSSSKIKPIQPPKVGYSRKQGFLDDNMRRISYKTLAEKAKSGKSSFNLKSQRKKHNRRKSNDCDSDEDEDNVEFVNGQWTWDADIDSMEDNVPANNIINSSGEDGSPGVHNPLSILKYEVIEENEANDVNDPSNEYSTPLLNGFSFGMSQEEENCILSASAASSAVTAVPEFANDDFVDTSRVKVEAVKMECMSDDENVESCAIVPETQIDGNNPEYSRAVTEGAIPHVQVKTEPLEHINIS